MSENLSDLLKDAVSSQERRRSAPPIPPSSRANMSSPPIPPSRGEYASPPRTPLTPPVGRPISTPTTPPTREVYNPAAAPVRPPEEPLEIEIEDEFNAAKGNIPDLDDALLWMLKEGGSDLFLSANAPPTSKIHGENNVAPGFYPLSGREIESMIYTIISDKQRKQFEEEKELDCSYQIPGKSRFRVNVFRSKGEVSAVLRTIPFEIKAIEELGLPRSLNEYIKFPNGLVLVTGPTGSGKSTTLAALIDLINKTRKGHIITIEDPIEFVHGHGNCIVNQREIGTDTQSFQHALKAVLREAPDYILVGEMRDYETISLALTAAETGHLVFGTLHTNSAPETISRIIDVFPADQQEQVRTQLAASLKAVVCQNLIRTADGNGRVAALEIMNVTQSVKSKIKKGDLAGIVSDLQLGEKQGMQTMDSHLERLVRDNIITLDVALDKAHRQPDMIENFGGDEEVQRLLDSRLSPRARRR